MFSMEHRISRQHVVDMCRSMLERGFLKATEGNVGADPRAPALRRYAEQLRLRPDARRGHLHRRLRRQARARPGRLRPGVDRVRHARQRLPRAPRRQRDRPHPPAVRLGPGLPPQGDPGADRRAGALPRQACGGDHRLCAGRHRSSPRTCRRRSPAATTRSSSPTTASSPSAPIPTAPCSTWPSSRRSRSPTSWPHHRGGQGLHDPGRDQGDRLHQAARGREADRRPDHRVRPAGPQTPRRCRARTRRPNSRRPGQPEPETRLVETPGSELGRSANTPTSTTRCAAQGAGGPAGARLHDALLDVLDYFDTKCAASKEITDRAKARIPAASSTTWPSTTRSRWRSTRPRAHLTDRDGNTYIDFLQAGGPTILGSNYAPVNEQVEVIRGVRPGDRPVPRVRAQARRVDPPLHAAHRDVPLAGLRHRGRDGRRPRAARSPAQGVKVGGAYHGWSDAGLRPARARHLPDERQGHPFGATSHTRESFPHDLGQLKRKLLENRPAAAPPRCSSSRSARSRAPARPRATSTRRSASCATSSARCCLRRGGDRLPGRHGRCRGLLRRHPRPDRPGQGRLGRLPDGGGVGGRPT